MLEPFSNKKDAIGFLNTEISDEKAPKWLCDMAEKCINQYEVVKLAQAYMSGAIDEKQPKVEKKVSKGGTKQESVPDKED